jgi:hydrogenase maturation protein HypF
LPGGDQAVKEPRRSALGLLYEIVGDEVRIRNDWASVGAFSQGELSTIFDMLEKQINSPRTSSAGRLFDAVASLIGIRQRVRHEGQAAMELEFAADGEYTDEAYPFRLAECKSNANERTSTDSVEGQWMVDWEPMIRGIIDDLQQTIPTSWISAKFHNTLVEMMIEVAKHVGEERVVLSGGCFQNQRLTERAVQRLKQGGFRPYWHQHIPPNDGGIAVGQAMIAGCRFKEASACA